MKKEMERVNFHGWMGSIILDNGLKEIGMAKVFGQTDMVIATMASGWWGKDKDMEFIL